MVWMSRSPEEQREPRCTLGRRLWTAFCWETSCPAIRPAHPSWKRSSLMAAASVRRVTRPATLQNRVRNTTSQGAHLTPHSPDLSPVERLRDVLDKHVRPIEAPTTPPPSEDMWSPYLNGSKRFWSQKGEEVRMFWLMGVCLLKGAL